MTRERLNNRYRLDAELGRGGMGIIYEAHDELLDRPVAVKLLSRSNLSSAGSERLLAEARAVARLNHPNIVSVYDAGEADGVPYIVMELLRGQSLHEHHPAGLAEVVSIGREVCLALEHAHAQGIIHRDLKPENVLIGPGGQVKLMDFGLARSYATRLSGEQTISGTVFYLAPELALGRPFDGRSDLYALGVMLYELVAGRLPFLGEDLLSVISQHLYAPVVPPRTYRADLPPALEAIILRLMAKTPEERFDDASATYRALSGVIIPTALAQAGETDEVEDRLALVDQLAQGRMVGRQLELDELRELWRHVRQGHSHMALISGEPGIGKTRLAKELLVQAQLNGAVVLRGGCYEYELGTPYLPFIEALREWVHPRPADELRLLLGSTATELARLAPEIELKLGPLPPNPPLPVNEERLRLFDHVTRFLQQLAAPHGLLLFVDDLHWADQGTLHLLHYITRSLRDEPLLVLGAYREMELDRNHPLSAALVEWNREGATRRIALGRLARAHVADLLSALLGPNSPVDDLAQVIYQETEGNPFFIGEVVKSLVEQGLIFRKAGRWSLGEISDLAIPQSIKEAVGRRLSRQTPTCLDVLHLAAVLGRKFDFASLAAICVHTEDEVLDALDEAVAAQLVETLGSDSFRFTHDKVREVLYEELNPIRRRRLHQRVGEGIEALHRDHLDARVQDLAHHFTQSGDLTRALEYNLRSADQAEDLYAHADALKAFERALECAETLQMDESIASIHESIGAIHFIYGTIENALRSFQACLKHTQQPEVRARVEMRIGSAYTITGDERGLEYLERAVQTLDRERQADVLADALAAIGRFYHYRADWPHAFEYLEKARQIAERIDHPVVGTVYAYLSGACQQSGDLPKSIYWANQCIRLGQQRNLPHATALGYEFLAEDAVFLDRWQDALVYAGKDREVAEKIGSLARMGWAEAGFTYGYYGQGNLIMALAAAAAALTQAERIGDVRLAVYVRAARAQMHVDLGNLQAAEQDVNFCLARARELGLRQLWAWALPAEGRYRLEVEDWAAIDRWIPEIESKVGYTPWLIMLSGYARQGRTAELAGRLAAGEFHHDEILPSPDDHARGHLALGEFRLAEGDLLAARRHLDEAVDVLAQMGSRLWQAVALALRGRLNRRAGQFAAARADLRQASELLGECGSLYRVAQVKALLAELETA